MEDKFPNASELYAQTKKYKIGAIDNNTTKTLDKLMDVIRERSKEGSYELYTEFILSTKVVKFLESKGYNVTGDNGAYCENAYWIISWEKSKEDRGKRKRVDKK